MRIGSYCRMMDAEASYSMYWKNVGGTVSRYPLHQACCLAALARLHQLPCAPGVRDVVQAQQGREVVRRDSDGPGLDADHLGQGPVHLGGH